jgi:hypothetical protein
MPVRGLSSSKLSLSLFRILIELRNRRTCARFDNAVSLFGDQDSKNPVAEPGALFDSQVFDQRQHPVPRRFQIVGQPRDLRDVIRRRDFGHAESGENRQIARHGQVWTQQPPLPDLQLDAEQRVHDFDISLLQRGVEPVTARARRADPVAIDDRNQLVAQLAFDFGGNLFDANGARLLFGGRDFGHIERMNGADA